MDKPKRRYELKLELGADDLRSLIGSLNHIMFCLESEPEDTPRNIVSGGYSSGYVLDLTVDTAITHESWEKVLEAYLAEKKAQKESEAGL